MSYGYGARQNPFEDQEDNGYGHVGGGPRYNQPPTGQYDHPQSNVEMEPLTSGVGSFGQGDPNAILNECREIDRGIDEIERNLSQLRVLQDRSLNDADTSTGSSTSRQLDNLSSDTMTLYRNLTQRVREIKSSPESHQPKNAPQVGRVDRRLKQAIQSYQQVESAFRKKTQDQMARQYRIVRPDATEAEVRAAVEDATQGAQVFQQALMQSDRRGQAGAVLNAVQDRQAALEKIERQMVELAQLFQDMDTLVVQQGAQVEQIDQRGEETVENLDKGNHEVEVAVGIARKTRRKKWICLGIVVAIIIIVVIIVVVYVEVTKGNKKDDDKSSSATRSIDLGGSNHALNDRAGSDILIPGIDYEVNNAATDARRADHLANVEMKRYRVGVTAGTRRGETVLPINKRIVLGPKAHRGVPQVDKKWVKVGEEWTGDDAASKAEPRWVKPNVETHGDALAAAARVIHVREPHAAGGHQD